MPILKQAPPTPPKPANSGNVGRKGFKSQVKKPSSHRRRPIEGVIYGEELFSSIVKKEREIVIPFHPFTKNLYRISKDGKFIIEKILVKVEILSVEDELPLGEFEEQVHWNLYYFPVALSDFDPPTSIDEFKQKEYVINMEACELFADFCELKSLEDKVIGLVRQEFLDERLKKLNELRAEDARLQAEKDALEESEEKANELANGNTTEHILVNISENNNEPTQSEIKSEISEETNKENCNEEIPNQENGTIPIPIS